MPRKAEPWTFRKKKSSGARCKSCGRRINSRPLDTCIEKRHLRYYRKWKSDMRQTMRERCKIPYDKWTGSRDVPEKLAVTA
jgi:hypothetical protein